MNEKPTENRKYTGSDKEFTAEQVANLLKSTEFDAEQRKTIKNIAATAVTPEQQKRNDDIQVNMSMELIRGQKDGDLLIAILKCRYAGYSHEKIAKTLMKSERDLPHFTSLDKAVKFVKDKEHEAFYRVKVALAKKSRIIIP